MNWTHALESAVRHHQAGAFPQAESLYRQILAHNPHHPDALHLLGLLAQQTDRIPLALDLLRRAAALKTNDPACLADLAESSRAAGLFDEAIHCYHRALSLRPDCPEVWYNLANILREQGHLDQAIPSYQRARDLKPDDPDIHRNLGVALKQQGRLDEAIASHRRALELQPASADSWNNLANALAAQAAYPQAAACYQKALALRPDWREALNNLGTVHLKLGQIDDAIACHQRALSLDPSDPRAHCYLGDCLAARDLFEPAIDSYRQALSIDPNHHETLNNLGNVLAELLRLDEAIACYRQSLAAQPDLLETHTNLAHALLTQGKLQEGFAQQESRWRLGVSPSPGVESSRRIWTGGDIASQSILVHAEQGFGDTIQFARYIPLLADRAATVIVQCQPELHRLLQSLPGATSVVMRGQPLPPTDFQTLLLTLPAAFATNLQTIPSTVPYLRPPRDAQDHWHRKLATDDSILNVGLVWAGNPRQKNDRNRSMPLSLLAPLGRVQKIRFHSLQKGPAAIDAKSPPPGLPLIDHSDDLSDFADTAALIDQLDLVIGVDTAVSHLAGAMGKPVWTLLTFAPDWRWLLQRQDNPWYPTMRLFRQPTRGDWTAVVQQVADALSAFAAHRPA